MTRLASPPGYGLGRRKTSVARLRLTADPKQRLVNTLPFERYFPTIDMQAQALAALKITSQESGHGFTVRVNGGGKLSQAGAVRLALARALLTLDAGWRQQLKAHGLLTRDPRAKERKKPGLKRARRAPQFSKR